MTLRIVASDPPASLRLYRDVLGWEVVAPGRLRAGDPTDAPPAPDESDAQPVGFSAQG